MQFDLVSDLHLDYWKHNTKDWRGLGTSLYCVVAGDVSRNIHLTTSFLRHLSTAYKQVIFIEGNHEHNKQYHDLNAKEFELSDALRQIPNVTYLAENSCVIDGTAFVGAMGWWTFDFPAVTGAGHLSVIEEFCARENFAMRDAMNIWNTAQEQADNLGDIVASLQDEDDIDEIVMITHTVPRNDIIHPGIAGSLSDWGKIGNSSMKQVLNYDYENKISTWCFGHFHEIAYDKVIDGVRYLSHPRGKPKDAPSQVYFPKLVDTDPVIIKMS